MRLRYGLPLLCLGATWLSAAGCRGPAGEAPVGPLVYEAKAQPAPLPAPPVKLDTAATPGQELRWASPPCPLRYWLAVDIEMHGAELPGGPPRLRIRSWIDADGRAAGGMRLRARELQMGHGSSGVDLPAPKQPDGAFAEVRLAPGPRGWQEVDGPTSLWAALGTFPGLAVFWPDLPASAAPGTRTAWPLRLHSRTSSAAAEQARGSLRLPEGAVVPKPTSSDVAAQVELRRWGSVEGMEVAELQGGWVMREQTRDIDLAAGQGTPPADPPALRVRATAGARGRWLVRRDGLLLHAQLEIAASGRMQLSGRNSGAHGLDQRHTTRAQLSLVRACGGPRLERATESPSAETRALQAYSDLLTALLEGRDQEAATLLAPELDRRHGRQRLVALLRAHLERYGPSSLGLPWLAAKAHVTQGQLELQLSGSAANHEPGVSLSLSFTVRGRIDSQGVQFNQIGADPVRKASGWSFLEIASGARLRLPHPGQRPSAKDLRYDAPAVEHRAGERIDTPGAPARLDGRELPLLEGERVEAWVRVGSDLVVALWQGVAGGELTGLGRPIDWYRDRGGRIGRKRVGDLRVAEAARWSAFGEARLTLLRLEPAAGDRWARSPKTAPLRTPAWGPDAIGSLRQVPRPGLQSVGERWVVAEVWTADCNGGAYSCHPYRRGQAFLLRPGGLLYAGEVPVEVAGVPGQDLCELLHFGYRRSFADINGDGLPDLRIEPQSWMALCDGNLEPDECLRRPRRPFRRPGLPLHYLMSPDSGLGLVGGRAVDLIDRALQDPTPTHLGWAVQLAESLGGGPGDQSSSSPVLLATLCAIDPMEGASTEVDDLDAVLDSLFSALGRSRLSPAQREPYFRRLRGLRRRP